MLNLRSGHIKSPRDQLIDAAVDPRCPIAGSDIVELITAIAVDMPRHRSHKLFARDIRYRKRNIFDHKVNVRTVKQIHFSLSPFLENLPVS